MLSLLARDSKPCVSFADELDELLAMVKENPRSEELDLVVRGNLTARPLVAKSAAEVIDHANGTSILP